jgi:hypothetical protein
VACARTQAARQQPDGDADPLEALERTKRASAEAMDMSTFVRTLVQRRTTG